MGVHDFHRQMMVHKGVKLQATSTLALPPQT